jgi:hypothetical protein
VRAYIHVEGPDTLTRLHTTEAQVRAVLDQVSNGGGPPWLALALYLVDGVAWMGKTYVAVRTPADFRRVEAERWALVERWRAPANLPERYTLVRVAIGQDIVYPFTDTD